MGDNETLKTYVEPWRQAQITKALKHIKIVAGAKELGGKLRYLAEGLTLPSECNSLVQLAKVLVIYSITFVD